MGAAADSPLAFSPSQVPSLLLFVSDKIFGQGNVHKKPGLQMLHCV